MDEPLSSTNESMDVGNGTFTQRNVYFGDHLCPIIPEVEYAEWNTSINVSYDFDDTKRLEDILNRTFLPIVCVGGIVGIILTVLVLSRKNMCTSTNCYLKSLAITDLIFLVLLTTRLLDKRVGEISDAASHRFGVYLSYLEITLQFFNLASIWLTVMLSIERYIAICHPLRAVSLSTVSGARRIIAFIYVAAFLCGLPKFWEVEVLCYTEAATNARVAYISPSALALNVQYVLAYRILYEGILSAIQPFLFLITINCRLIQEIHKSTRYLRHHLAADSIVSHVISAEQLQLTLMLIGITLVFFLCQAPYVIYTVIGVVYQYRNTMHNKTFHVFKYISLLLLSVKSAINFVLYCWFSEKFRVTFKRLFCMPNCLTRPQMRRLSNNSHNHLRKNSYHTSKETTC